MENAYQRKRMADKIAAGICVRCSRPAVAGLTRCDVHRSEDVAKRKKRRDAGRCIFCSSAAVSGRCMCEKHLLATRSSQRKRVTLGKCRRCSADALPKKHHCAPCGEKRASEELQKRALRASAGLCIYCGKRSTGQRCKSCIKIIRDRRYALKLEVLNAYGGPKCTCCGTTEVPFLTLEHPDGDGASHRKMLVGGRASGRFYRELKKLGFPKKPRMVVHCFNCNVARGQFGTCPHVFARKK